MLRDPLKIKVAVGNRSKSGIHDDSRLLLHSCFYCYTNVDLLHQWFRDYSIQLETHCPETAMEVKLLTQSDAFLLPVKLV